MLLLIVPVEPGDFVILAVGVVVALLRVAHLVAREHHRYALTHHEHRDGVFHLAVAQGDDFRIISITFAATVPTVVVVLAVAVVLAVGLVVLAVIGYQVHEREAVMGGDEVHAGLDAAPL